MKIENIIDVPIKKINFKKIATTNFLIDS